MNKLIKYFNEKYSKEYGKIAYPRTTLQIYRTYQSIKSYGIKDEKLVELLHNIKLPKPKTIEEKELYTDCLYNKDDSEITSKGYLVAKDIENKVDKVNGKGLSTVDFTTVYETKLKGLSNYDDTKVKADIQTINSQLGDIVNKKTYITPEDFGAKGDGITDDTVALQNAINEAQSQSIPIRSKYKTYLISTPITITNKIDLDFSNSILTSNTNINNIIDVASGQNHYSQIKNLTIDCNNIENLNGFNISHAEKLEINHLIVKNCTKSCYKIDSGYEVFMSNSHLNGVGENSIGLNINTSDCNYTDIILIDCFTGIFSNNTNNYYTRIHGWIKENTLLNSTFININNGNIFIKDCYSDTYYKTIYVNNPANIVINGLNVYYFDSDKVNNEYKINNPYVFYFNEITCNSSNSEFITLNNSIIKGSDNFNLNLSNLDELRCKGFYNNIYTKCKNIKFYKKGNISIDDTSNIEVIDEKIINMDNKITINIVLQIALDNINHDQSITLGVLPSGFRPIESIYTYAILSKDRYKFTEAYPLYVYISSSGSIIVNIPSNIIGKGYAFLDFSF